MNLNYDSTLGKLIRLPLKLIPSSVILPIMSGPGGGRNGLRVLLCMGAGWAGMNAKR